MILLLTLILPLAAFGETETCPKGYAEFYKQLEKKAPHAKKTAIEYIRFVAENSGNPDAKMTEQMKAKVSRYVKDVHPAFIDTVNADPKTLRHFQRNFGSAPSRAAYAIIDFLLNPSNKSKLPSQSHDRKLYDRLWTYRDELEFNQVLKSHPEAWDIYQAALKDFRPGAKPVARGNHKGMKTAKKVALELIEFLHDPKNKKRMPNYAIKGENGLSRQYYEFRGDPVFKETMKETKKSHPEVWEIYDEATSSIPRKAALHLIRFARQIEADEGALRPLRTSKDNIEERRLYERVNKYIGDPEFDNTVKEEHPKLWELLQAPRTSGAPKHR